MTPLCTCAQKLLVSFKQDSLFISTVGYKQKSAHVSEVVKRKLFGLCQRQTFHDII